MRAHACSRGRLRAAAWWAAAVFVLCSAAPLGVLAQPNPALYSHVVPQQQLSAVAAPSAASAPLMPDVRGLSLADAQLVLRERIHRLATDVSTTPSARPKGTVVSQSPAPGGRALLKAPIGLALSEGPAPKPKPLPPVIQFPFPPTASSTPKPRPEEPPSEKPPAKPDLVVVPPLAGLTAVEARNRLGLDRLLLGHATEQASPRPGGRILSTTPPAGAQVRPGSSIDYVETSGRNIVPSVVGLTETAAAARLEAAGFGHAVDTATSGSRRLDSVAAQSPAAGAEDYLESEVRLTMKMAVAPPPPPPPPQPQQQPKPPQPPPPKPPQAAVHPPPPRQPPPRLQSPPPAQPQPQAQAQPQPQPQPQTQPQWWPMAEKIGAGALLILALAGAAALALRAMVHVAGMIQGGVEVAAQVDEEGASGSPAPPSVLMGWDLQVEPAVAYEGAAVSPEPAEEAR